MAKAPRPTLRFIDRVVLFVAWVVTCAVVYVLGYYVGRGTPDRRAVMEERTVRLPVTSTPPPEGQREKEAKDFPSFYQALPAGERPIDVARGTPPPPTTLTPSTTPSRPTTTLPGTAPASLPRQAPPTSTTVVRTAPTSTTTPHAAVITPVPPTAPRVAVTATTVVQATVPRAVTVTTVPPTAATIVPRTATRGGFTVEASPTRSRSEAEQLQSTLRRRGYDATIVQMDRDGDTWYRLRVGRYPSAEQATETMRRLRDVEGITHVFVATE